jgi:hypothetical protein
MIFGLESATAIHGSRAKIMDATTPLYKLEIFIRTPGN